MIRIAAPLVKPVRTGWLMKLTNPPMRKAAINIMMNPPSADNITALSTGWPKALISGAVSALAIMIAAIETGPTDKVRLVPNSA